MRELVLGIIAAIGAFLGLRAAGKEGQNLNQTFTPQVEPTTRVLLPVSLDDLYNRWGSHYNVDPLLLKAIARVESSENPNAENPTDPSVGLMQILCTPDGSGGCANTFLIDGWPPPSKAALFNPDLNVQFGSQILAWNIRRGGFNRGIAMFNRFASLQDPENGPFGNQDYVDKVLEEFRALGGSIP